MIRLVAVSLSGLMLAGCFTQPPVDAVDRSPAPPRARAATSAAQTQTVSAGEYLVKKGDTLYRIALDHGLDYRELAAWNNMSNPSLLKEGQVLRLTPPGSEGGVSAVTTSPVVEARPLDKPGAGNAKATNGLLKEPRVGKEPYSDEAYARLGKQGEAVKPADVKPEATSEARKPVESSPASSPDDVSWQWPSDGRVKATYSDSGNKGIDFAGKAGDPVVAAGDGKVVYAGAGLRGYGELVIVKHNGTYLSAYAHNRKILVSEGQMVKRGQKIAEMGNTDADSVKLHFEIRRQGKPVDPAQYLPKK